MQNRDFVERCYKKFNSDSELILYFHSIETDERPEDGTN
jgi:hypothetical protein